jgi:hypothetical protein
LAENESYEVQFKVKVNKPSSGQRVPSIMNIARISSLSDANVKFTDDGTAIINPEEGPMPVTLAKFAATLIQGSRVQLDWSTSMEINCNKFVVEKSYDGNTFVEGPVVAGNGTTSLYHSYSITDDVSSAGSMIYYRLKQIDFDGKANLSKVIAVKINKENQVVSVSPNPFTSFVNIKIEWSKSEVVTARVINIQGKEIISKTMQVNKGTNSFKIDELSKLPPGNYFLQIVSLMQSLTYKIGK